MQDSKCKTISQVQDFPGLQGGVGKIDKEKRERLRKWLHYLKEIGGHETNDSFADALGFAEPTVNTYLNGTRTMGLDFFIALHEKCHVSADQLLVGDPKALPSGKPYPPPRAGRSRPAKAKAPPRHVPFADATHRGHGGRHGKKKAPPSPG